MAPPLRCRVVRPEGDAPPRRVVVLCHGFGAPGDDLVALGEWIEAPDTAWVFPEAPMELGGLYGDSRAWWMIDLAALERDLQRGVPRDRAQEIPDGLAEARAALLALLPQIAKDFGVGPERIVLGGFSQGAMLTLDVALHSPDTYGALVLLSGTLLARSVWEPLLPRLAGVPVLMSHGTKDALLPYRAAETLRDLVAAAGAQLTFIPFDGGHEIPPPLLDEVEQLIVSIG